MRRASTAVNLFLGAAIGATSVGAASIALNRNVADYQLQGYRITWNSGDGSNFPLKQSDKITCYADKLTVVVGPEGKTVVVLEGGPQEYSADARHLPLAKGPECYFGDHNPASDITKGYWADSKAVAGVEGATDFKPFHGIQEGAVMYPFAIDSSRVVEVAASPDMLGNFNSRK